jgi:hypothetical protein
MLLKINDGDVLIEVSRLNDDQKIMLGAFLKQMPSAVYQRHKIGGATIALRSFPWVTIEQRTQRIHTLGGHGTLTHDNFLTLKSTANKQLFDLFLDGEPHTSEEISIVSNQQEGVKRMRELRPLFRFHGLDIKYFQESEPYYKIVKADAFSAIQERVMNSYDPLT